MKLLPFLLWIYRLLKLADCLHTIQPSPTMLNVIVFCQYQVVQFIFEAKDKGARGQGQCLSGSVGWVCLGFYHRLIIQIVLQQLICKFMSITKITSYLQRQGQGSSWPRPRVFQAKVRPFRDQGKPGDFVIDVISRQRTPQGPHLCLQYL